jgi:hypothetical protein
MKYFILLVSFFYCVFIHASDDNINNNKSNTLDKIKPLQSERHENTTSLSDNKHLLKKIKTGEIVVNKLDNGKLQIILTEKSFLDSIIGHSEDWRLNGPWLVFCILAMFCLVCSLYFFYFKADRNILAFKITVLIILSLSSLILIIGGYAKEQIVPVIGFFSTVAGFLLGSREQADKKENPGSQNN